MSCLIKAKKCNLLSLCKELGINVLSNTTVAKHAKLIKESADLFEDFTKSCFEVIKEEKERKEETEIAEKEREIEKGEKKQEKYTEREFE